MENTYKHLQLNYGRLQVLLLLHFMICHSKNAIDHAPQAVTKTYEVAKYTGCIRYATKNATQKQILILTTNSTEYKSKLSHLDAKGNPIIAAPVPGPAQAASGAPLFKVNELKTARHSALLWGLFKGQ